MTNKNEQLKIRIEGYREGWDQYRLNKWNEKKNMPQGRNVFYLITKHQAPSEYTYQSFEFKFGITTSMNMRFYQHRRKWGAHYENSIMVTSSKPTFSRDYESHLKIGKGQSEFRTSMNEYNKICKELIDFAINIPELGIKFFIHENYNLSTSIDMMFRFDERYSDRKLPEVFHHRVSDFSTPFIP